MGHLITNTLARPFSPSPHFFLADLGGKADYGILCNSLACISGCCLGNARFIAPALCQHGPGEEFWERGAYFFPMLNEEPVFLREFVEDPIARRLNTPSGKIEIFSKTIDSFGYDDCPCHPTWLEPVEWLGSPRSKTFPFHLLTNRPATRLHSQLDATPETRRTKIAGREPIEIGRHDADARGFKTGDIVRVFNERGALLAGFYIVDDLCPGVAIMATGAWYDPEEPGRPGTLEKHGNSNVLTLDKSTPHLSQSTAAQTVLVDIELFDGPVAPVSAFDGPCFVEE